MGKFTLLSDQLLTSRFYQLEIFKKRDFKAAITDYAILLGGFVSDQYHSGEGIDLKDRTGNYWIRTDKEGKFFVTYFGYINHEETSNENIGVRPITLYSKIKKDCQNSKNAKDGILELEYGQYPQNAVPKDLQQFLERTYQFSNRVKLSTNRYSSNCGSYDKWDLKINFEYEYQGKKYIRMKANFCPKEGVLLSNSETYQNGDIVWIEVSPVKWWVDRKTDIAVSENILFAGIPLEKKLGLSYSQIDVEQFMKEYFSKEIAPDFIISKNGKRKVLRKKS